MSRVKLSRVESLFEELSYPIARERAADEFVDTTVTYADGEGNLGELVSQCPSAEFAGSDELLADLNNVLPVEAVGEPGQSEGDA
ncbi:DUF5789 family protein [Candidatus Halobonum tyrrellensis]|uniref:DUF2795 domain-containing protein n=1 Tax=Candidatus Halobonum tyrrellensis G22 TaxID=1324957 RepID=V4HC72_9EURY|nr:hypothetical protein [Candidatus Halobonum tyrrellensis]ESP87658.1 hypothetical protein K933_13107 [Candidatus Halobonum tyrrellensis G22]